MPMKTEDFDNDYQGIFSLDSHKAYWVKLSPKSNITGSITNDSTLTQNVTPHFDNAVTDIDLPIATTRNDIDHRLVVYLNTTFLDPLNTTFYDVSAIIDGTRYPMRSSGSNFQLEIRNKEMNLIERPSGGDSYPIIIEAYDGLGNIFKENINNARFKIDYSKPPTPSIRWNEIAEPEIINASNYDVEAYATYISDLESQRESDKLEYNLSNYISEYTTTLGWEKSSDTTDDDGIPIILKVVSKDRDTSMYSDALTILYAPLRFGHVLEVNETDVDHVDTIPYSFIQKGMLNKTDRSGNRVNINGGIQLNKQQAAIANNNARVAMVYYPAGGENKEAFNEISRFGGSYTMFLQVTSSDSAPIASITYIPEYAGSRFYIEYENNLYIGEFAPDDMYGSDSSAYTLTDDNTNMDVLSIQNGTAVDLMMNGRELRIGSNYETQHIFNGMVSQEFLDRVEEFEGASAANNNTNNNNTNNTTTPANNTATLPVDDGGPTPP